MPRRNKNAGPRPTAGKRRGPKNTTKQKEVLNRVRLVEIELHARHTINGHAYGPGRVRVRGDVARVLLEQEQRAVAHEDRFYGKRAGLILPGPGTVVKLAGVPYDHFDAAYAQAMPIGTASPARFVPYGG